MLPSTGDLPTTEAALCTINSPRGATVEWCQCVNDGTAQAIVQFFVTVRGVKASLTPPVPSPVGQLVDVVENKPPLRLGKGDYISGVSTLADVSFLISGVET